KEFYKKARLTILPIKNTLQPSGQSVALQSMSMGVPVIITETDGFWDFTNFENNKNILFVENNEVVTWKKKIIEIYENLNLLEIISSNSRKTIEISYDINTFNDKIEEIILS
ncbi:MAG: glycosyltransferase, partial [Pelagibacteraceae bacterium]